MNTGTGSSYNVDQAEQEHLEHYESNRERHKGGFNYFTIFTVIFAIFHSISGQYCLLSAAIFACFLFVPIFLQPFAIPFLNLVSCS